MVYNETLSLLLIFQIHRSLPTNQTYLFVHVVSRFHYKQIVQILFPLHYKFLLKYTLSALNFYVFCVFSHINRSPFTKNQWLPSTLFFVKKSPSLIFVEMIVFALSNTFVFILPL